MASLPFLSLECSLFCLPILGDSFCLSLCFLMFWVASSLLGWMFMLGILWVSVVWSLISLSGHSRFALSSIYVGYLVVLGFLSFGGSFVGGFSPPEDILTFAAPTYSCMWSVAGGRQNGLRQQEGILWDLKYQQVEKRQEILWISIALTVIFHPTSHF